MWRDGGTDASVVADEQETGFSRTDPVPPGREQQRRLSR